MKKFMVVFVMLVSLMMVGTAQAGPIDSLFGWFGYTPTVQYDAAMKEAAAYKAAAADLSATVAQEETFGKTAGLILLGVGGLAYFRRKKIATKILETPEKS